MQIVFARSALKGLGDMAARRAEGVLRMMREIAADPGIRHNELKPLKGVPNGFRLRSGDWRISFTLDRSAGVLEVFEVAPRGKAYR